MYPLCTTIIHNCVQVNLLFINLKSSFNAFNQYERDKVVPPSQRGMRLTTPLHGE